MHKNFDKKVNKNDLIGMLNAKADMNTTNIALQSKVIFILIVILGI